MTITVEGESESPLVTTLTGTIYQAALQSLLLSITTFLPIYYVLISWMPEALALTANKDNIIWQASG